MYYFWTIMSFNFRKYVEKFHITKFFHFSGINTKVILIPIPEKLLRKVKVETRETRNLTGFLLLCFIAVVVYYFIEIKNKQAEFVYLLVLQIRSKIKK